MEDLAFAQAALHVHSLEIYSARFYIEGEVTAPFKRMSDLLNRREANYLSVQGAVVAPLDQASQPKRFEMPISVGKSHIHFASPPEMPGADPKPDAPQRGIPIGREFYVQKIPFPCYVLTDTFVIHGQCYFNEGVTLQSLLDRPDMLFLPITDAVIYMVARPNISWQRNLVIVNKEKIEVIYLTDESESKAQS
jgi:hypothetical protein